MSGGRDGRGRPRRCRQGGGTSVDDYDSPIKPCARPRRPGIGLVPVRRTTHTAAIGYDTRRDGGGMHGGDRLDRVHPQHALSRLARAVGLDEPAIVRRAGRGRAPLVLDMRSASSRWAGSRRCAAPGKSLMPGWALDAEGNETSDAAKAELPLPLGGPKGAGLSRMAECIASILTGNPILASALSDGGQAALHRQNSFIIAIDIARFGDPAAFRAGVARLVGVLKGLPLQPGFEEILMPGERGDRTYQRGSHAASPSRRRRGPISPKSPSDLAGPCLLSSDRRGSPSSSTLSVQARAGTDTTPTSSLLPE